MQLLKEYWVSSKHELAHVAHKQLDKDFVDNVYLSIYQENRQAEFNVEWITLGNDTAIRMKVFDDAWWALGYTLDMQTFLAQMGNKLTVENLCGFLDSVSYVEA